MSEPDESSTEESGKDLRARLEESIGKNRTLEKQLAGFLAADVIEAKGLSYVAPEDLADVPLDQLEEKADQLQEERAKVFEGAIRRQFEQAGFEGDALNKQVQDFVSGTGTPKQGAVSEETSEAMSRVRQLGTTGAPPARNPETMSTMQKLEAGLG